MTQAQREYLVKCSNLHGTYSTGRYVASSPTEAKALAADVYRNSPLGRQLKDVGAFRFWIATEED